MFSTAATAKYQENVELDQSCVDCVSVLKRLSSDILERLPEQIPTKKIHEDDPTEKHRECASKSKRKIKGTMQSRPGQDANTDFHDVDSPVYCECSTLDPGATEV
uniref:Uncharacterized protein n=1 Tax=Timema monikensis TaxID=170555 RepID=A0A7R9EID0_9NEOP|nr:unnamed protein product [Timema monikensis]